MPPVTMLRSPMIASIFSSSASLYSPLLSHSLCFPSFPLFFQEQNVSPASHQQMAKAAEEQGAILSISGFLTHSFPVSHPSRGVSPTFALSTTTSRSPPPFLPPQFPPSFTATGCLQRRADCKTSRLWCNPPPRKPLPSCSSCSCPRWNEVDATPLSSINFMGD